jgi:hypothetical protein
LADATARLLRVYRARAREGKCVEEASEIARYVVSSGLAKLAGASSEGELQELVQGTLHDCACHWNNQGQGPWVAKSELEALNAKVDNLCGMIAAGLRQAPTVIEITTAQPLALLPAQVPETSGLTATRASAATSRPR